MKLFKTALCLVLLLVGAIITNVWSDAIQPEVATDLALEQFANPSIETDTKLRLLNSAEPDLLVWFIVGVLCFLVWLPEIFDYAKGNVSNEEV